jgi:aromatic-L-amino-acid decarboxylase
MDATDPEVFRAQAHALVDWMANYLRDVRSYPVVPDVRPGALRAQLPSEPPAEPESFERQFADFCRLILPGMTHWNHPRFFAYFPANHSPPSILAEMLTATLGAQCMSWQTSPAATELEQVMMSWLGRLVGVPHEWAGVIQDSASTATLVALLSARERASGGTFASEGAGDHRLTVYASAEAHSSVDKGVKLAGYGLKQLRRIEVDADFAMVPEALEAALTRDRAAGFHPACVIATCGSTSSTAIDPIRKIGEICRRHNVWLHIDAAYAGSAAILPEKRAILDGIELADSMAFNPHKWLFTNFDCSAYFVKSPEWLLKTFAQSADYLKTSVDREVVNFRDWGIQLGRRFRALKLWFVMRSFGVSGLQTQLRRHIDLAARFRGWVESQAGFELMAPAPLALVCFRCRPAHLAADAPEVDALNEQLLARINATGQAYLTPTRLKGRYAIRFSVGQLQTSLADVEACWSLITRAASELHA